MLHDYLLSFIILIEDKRFSSKTMFPFIQHPLQKSWFQEFMIELLRRSALSFDLNPIKNLYLCEESLWSREAANKKYCRTQKKKIKSAWADIPNDILNKLFRSVPDLTCNKKIKENTKWKIF